MHPLRTAALFVFLCSRMWAQSASAPNPQAIPATVLKANANLVLIDVIVTNHDHPVHGLKGEQFHISEDGRPQAIVSFDEHKPAPGAALPAPKQLPPHTFSNVPLYPETGAINVLLLDGLNTPAADQQQVRRQMLDYLGSIPPGTPLAIFTLGSRLSLVEGFTTDPAVLVKALRNPKQSIHPSPLLQSGDEIVTNAVINEMISTGPIEKDGIQALADAIATYQQFEADSAAFQTDLRARLTLEAMQQLARYLSAIPGRKNLIWLSGSFPVALDPDTELKSPFQAVRSYSREVHTASNLLSAARVAVYPVDARGLMNLPSSSASYTPSNNISGTRSMPSVLKDDVQFANQLASEQGTMGQIAEETGGKPYANINGLKQAVADALDTGTSYYTIGYVPAPPDGKFHKIQVRLDGEGYRLSYRRGYYADASDRPTARTPGAPSLIVQAAAHGAPPATQIRFSARVLAASSPEAQSLAIAPGSGGEMAASLKAPVRHYVVEMAVDARDLAFEEAPGGMRRTTIEFAVLVYDQEGKRLNLANRGFRMLLTPEQYATAQANGIPLRTAIDLPAGPVSLRIAVHDMESERVGSLEVPPSGTSDKASK